MTRSIASSLVATFLAVGGCGGASRLGQVEGVLRLNGEPLANVQVEYWPESEGRRSIGVTDEDGRYELTTDDQRAGAAIATHRVVLHDLNLYGDPSEDPGKKPRPGKQVKRSRLPAAYEQAIKTPLKKQVKDEKNTINLDLRR